MEKKFADWLAENATPIHVNTIYSGDWHYYPDQTVKTTSELFELFKFLTQPTQNER